MVMIVLHKVLTLQQMQLIAHSEIKQLVATKIIPGDTNPNFVPNMFNDPNNYNNHKFNLSNPYASVNPYDAPRNF